MSRLPALGPRGEGWVLLQAVLLGAVAVTGLAAPAWHGPARLITSVLGLVGLIGGGVLVLRGIVDLRSAMSPLPHPRPGGELVKTGVYRLVRHPIYAGLIDAAFAWGLLMASPPALAAAVVLAVFLDLKSRREEAWLVERYPAYEQYRARTRRLIPGLY